MAGRPSPHPVDIWEHNTQHNTTSEVLGPFLRSLPFPSLPFPSHLSSVYVRPLSAIRPPIAAADTIPCERAGWVRSGQVRVGADWRLPGQLGLHTADFFRLGCDEREGCGRGRGHVSTSGRPCFTCRQLRLRLNERHQGCADLGPARRRPAALG